ncbi:hypothetical protein, partial [Mycobacterium sp.]|uniref:hypothetical protein n=1 Tax=Mycobacterium sp. TaxID=1785 RepID=UPI003C794729
MLIIALVLALIGLVALVFAVVTSNELVAWVCIGASVVGVVLLIIDALRERQRRDVGVAGHDDDAAAEDGEDGYVDYPEEEVPDLGSPEAGAGVVEASEEAGAAATEESTVAAESRGDDPAK